MLSMDEQEVMAGGCIEFYHTHSIQTAKIFPQIYPK
jgi:hypothetical protein